MTEEELNELLAPLRSATPDSVTRRANRRAAHGFARPAPWWRRSISVPVPVAIATSAALVMSVGWGLCSDEPVLAERTGGEVVSEASPSDLRSSEARLASVHWTNHGAVYESASYVSGVGYIQRVSLYPIQD